jgi:hypothetical protein
MGSSYYGPNSDCYHCNGCGTHRPCDDCTANCCQENMNEHRRLRRLESTFIDKVYSAKQYVYNECKTTVNYLNNNYDIYIFIKNDSNKNYLEKSKDIIEAMKSKKEQIIKDASNIKEDRYERFKIQRIRDDHEKKMTSIRYQFKEKMTMIDNKYFDVRIQENEIKEKQETKSQLQKKRDEIKNKFDNDFENFKTEKENNLIKVFESKKNEIDLKYAFLQNIIEPNFEYSEEEKNERNYLLQSIKSIQMYSNIIPNYEIFMKKFGISNYL